MLTTVLIPWRPQPSRVPAFDTVVAWYRSQFGDVDIRTVDSEDDIFNLARCRNLGIALVGNPDQVVVINDADTIPERDALLEAVHGAATSGRVHLPYDEYRWLGAEGTAHVSEGIAHDDAAFELVHGACSGVYVTTPATWWAHGGQDETFRGWGFEDAAWYLAHETLLGEAPRRHAGRVFALHHEAAAREGEQYDANARRMEEYRAAAGDAVAMRQLVTSEANARALPGV